MKRCWLSELSTNSARLWDAFCLHELGADIGRAREIVDIDFVEMFQRVIRRKTILFVKVEVIV